MKTLILALSTVALVATSTVKAEFFSPNVVSGVVIGGIGGAVIGNNVSVYARPPALVYLEPTCAPTVVYQRPAVVYVRPYSRAEYRETARVYVGPRYRGRDHDGDHDHNSRDDHDGHRW